ncbi:hypothetical protein Bhyg_01060, partial [Pseudolycoriella hygida]
NLVIQQTYEEVTDDSIVPSTPTLYVARRADGFSEAVSSPHPTVPHASRFTFGESNATHTNRTVAASLDSSIEGMDDTRVDLNLLEGTGENERGTPVNTPTSKQNADNQQVVVVDLRDDDSSDENKEADQNEPVDGPSEQTQETVPQILVTNADNDQNNFEGDASTSQLTDDANIAMEAEPEDEIIDVEADGVSSGQDGVQVEEGREAEASQMNSDKRTTRQTRNKEENQRPTPIVWDDQQAYSQNRGVSVRGSHMPRGQTATRSRARGKRPF